MIPFLLQYHSYLSWFFLCVVARRALFPLELPFLEHLDVYHAFGFGLPSTLYFVDLDLVQGELRCESLNQKSAANSACRAIELDSGRFAIYWP